MTIYRPDPTSMNDPLKRRLVEAMIYALDARRTRPGLHEVGELGKGEAQSAIRSDTERVITEVLLGMDTGPLAGHVMLDLLEEKGLGPEEVPILAAQTGMGLALAVAIQAAATARGLGYHIAAYSPDGVVAGDDTKLVSGINIPDQRIVIVDPGTSRPEDIADIAYVIDLWGGEVAGYVFLGWPVRARESIDDFVVAKAYDPQPKDWSPVKANVFVAIESGQ